VLEKLLVKLIGPRPSAGVLPPLPIDDSLTEAAPETSQQAQPAEAAMLEKQRLKDILTCAEASGRERLAQVLALTTELPAAEARAILANFPCESSGHAPQDLPQESVKDGRQRQLAADFTEAFRKAEFATPEPSMSPAGVIERMQRAYATATGLDVLPK
jgi:hypothetical protein